MKIRLRAFQGKLQGVMEVPENTTPKFDLVLSQPIQAFNDGYQAKDINMMSRPLHTKCTFQWNGKYDGFGPEGARIYELVAIDSM